MDGGVGHIAWVPKGRKGQSQSGPKGCQLGVGPRRGPRLLVVYIDTLCGKYDLLADKWVWFQFCENLKR